MSDLSHLADLLRARNTVESNIANLLGTAVNLNTVGEYIAAHIFGIRLIPSAQHSEFAGIFSQAPLTGKTVDVQWYPRREGSMHVHSDPPPDYYLVLAGPKQESNTTRALVNPWLIRSVHLFDGHTLLNVVRERGVQISSRTSVINQLWEQAEIFPTPRNPLFQLTTEQRQLLQLFE
ncbi:MAG: hypothetical protein ACRDHZ_14870 [Ktedonobacteraceae bacterium]